MKTLILVIISSLLSPKLFAADNLWQYVALVGGSKRFACSSVILDESYILTASKCKFYVRKDTKDNPRVYFFNQHDVVARRTILKKVEAQFGMVIYKLDEPIPSSHKPAIPADRIGHSPDVQGKKLTAVAFGSQLHYGKDITPLIRPPHKQTFRGGQPIDLLTLHLQPIPGEHNSCNGDAGAPLFYESEGNYYWTGILQGFTNQVAGGKKERVTAYYEVDDFFVYKYRCGSPNESGGSSDGTILGQEVYQWLYGEGGQPATNPSGWRGSLKKLRDFIRQH